MANRLHFPVGRQRLSASTDPSEAGYTRAIRAQMDMLVRNTKATIAAIENISPDALIHALQPIYDDSQELVPVDTGELKASGFIEARLGSRGAEGVVGYARGGQPQYAVWVHENMVWFHKPPTQAKFLEEAVKRHVDDVPERYAEYVRTMLGL